MRKQFDDLEVQAVAYLRSLDHSQKDIAKFLGFSPSVVNRLVKQAQEDQYLKNPVPEFDRTKLSDTRMAEILARIAPKALTDALKTFQIKNKLSFVPEVRIFPTTHAGSSKETFVLRSKDFGESAAGYATELLLRSTRCVGVSWGTTVANLVTGIGSYCRRGARERKPITFLPLCGEPLGSTGSTNCSASTLATSLDDIFNGGSVRNYLLGAVPALIPRVFVTKEIAVIQKLMGHVEAYKKIFIGKANGNIPEEPLIDTVDTILTSLGAEDTALAWGEDELGRTAGFSRADLKKLIIGDISGVLIPKPNLSKADKAELSEIQQRWTGISEDQISNCAKRAERNKRARPAGVVVSTIGQNKADIVIECLKRCLVNHLLIDQDLADKLVQSLN